MTIAVLCKTLLLQAVVTRSLTCLRLRLNSINGGSSIQLLVDELVRCLGLTSPLVEERSLVLCCRWFTLLRLLEGTSHPKPAPGAAPTQASHAFLPFLLRVIASHLHPASIN